MDKINNIECVIDTSKSNRKIYNKENLLDISKSTEKSETLTTLQYYSYRLSYRPYTKHFSPLLFSGRLTQQYFLQALIMVESNRMSFFRHNQPKLRIEYYQGLYDHVLFSLKHYTKF